MSACIIFLLRHDQPDDAATKGQPDREDTDTQAKKTLATDTDAAAETPSKPDKAVSVHIHSHLLAL